MNKNMLRGLSLALILCLLAPVALAAKKPADTPTPAPVAITQTVQQPPEVIRSVLDLAYTEWETLAGKTLKNVNKYTEWRGKGIGFGWCGGYITWCMLQHEIPMEQLQVMQKNDQGPVDGVVHVKEASVGKLLRGYQMMNRSTNIPQPGFLLVYGCSYNKTIHIGLVYDVVELGGGKFRITTLEGNMSKRVKLYIRDYDMNVQVNTKDRKSTNLTVIPEEERTLEASNHLDYSIPSSKPSSGGSTKYAYYVNCFLMPWIPENMATTENTPEVSE
ncbi:MAG: hypothetical protein IKB78_06505 [Clostridia bacterium]|nr:hypothetical protein [Clostridia bacterium]